jgi:hypothetical protein
MSSGNVLGKKSKDAAYKLLNSLIKKSPLLMNAFLEKSMLPLMSLIKRHDGWNYQPPSNFYLNNRHKKDSRKIFSKDYCF